MIAPNTYFWAFNVVLVSKFVLGLHYRAGKFGELDIVCSSSRDHFGGLRIEKDSISYKAHPFLRNMHRESKGLQL